MDGIAATNHAGVQLPSNAEERRDSALPVTFAALADALTAEMRLLRILGPRKELISLLAEDVYNAPSKYDDEVVVAIAILQ